MPDYLNPPPPPVDPDAIAQATFDRIRESFPNYDPRDSQLATIVIVALALRAAEIADLIPLMPKSIFRWFGANIINLPPLAGGPASASVTFFLRDNLGYTVPADTTLAIEDAEGNVHLFALDTDAVVPPGSTSTGPVTVTALEDGADGNNITAGTVTMVEALDYVLDTTQQGSSSGGSDPEEDDDYLNRLSRRMGLAPRPVLAADFAALAMVQFSEVYRMAALDRFTPGTNEKQTLDHRRNDHRRNLRGHGYGRRDVGPDGRTHFTWIATAPTIHVSDPGGARNSSAVVTGGPLPNGCDGRRSPVQELPTTTSSTFSRALGGAVSDRLCDVEPDGGAAPAIAADDLPGRPSLRTPPTRGTSASAGSRRRAETT
jgi:hypothetical protein